MATRILFAAILSLCDKMALSMNEFAGCFTVALYDDDNPNKNDSWNRLFARKMQAIKEPLLDPIDVEIKRIEQIDSDGKKHDVWKLCASAIGAGIIPSTWPFVIPQALILGVKRAQSENDNGNRIDLLEARKKELLSYLANSGVTRLEKHFLVMQKGMDEQFRRRVKTLLIEMYDENKDHAAVITDLLSLRMRVRCISYNGDVDRFRTKLDLAHASFSRKMPGAPPWAKDVMNDLALSSLNAFHDGHGRCSIYVETQNSDRAQELFEHIASTLFRPLHVVNAFAIVLDEAALFGEQNGKRGILLETFLSKDLGERFRNPLLIILNIDAWMDSPNSTLLFDLLASDPVVASFHNKFLDVDIDWRALSILSCGQTPSSLVPNPLRSRLNCFKLN